jgi:tetratricopeptide (TPR) repeat protein
LTIADNRAGDILKTKGKLDEALALYREGLVVAKSLVAVDANNTLWMSDLQISVNRVGGIAYNLVLVREFTTALGASDDAVTAAPNSIWLQIDRAHALMFLGRTDDARALYLRYQKSQDVLSGKSWISLVLDDFAAFRKAGLTSPLMDDIEKLYST